MAQKQGCGSQLLGALLLVGLMIWGINSCSKLADLPQQTAESQANPKPQRSVDELDQSDLQKQAATKSGRQASTKWSRTATDAKLEDLCKAYLADQTQAARDYRGKSFQADGIVRATKWSPDKEEGLFVVLETSVKTNVVTGWFDKKDQKAVLALRDGQRAVIRGKIGDVVVIKEREEVVVTLEKCVIVRNK